MLVDLSCVLAHRYGVIRVSAAKQNKSIILTKNGKRIFLMLRSLHEPLKSYEIDLCKKLGFTFTEEISTTGELYHALIPHVDSIEIWIERVADLDPEPDIFALDREILLPTIPENSIISQDDDVKAIQWLLSEYNLQATNTEHSSFVYPAYHLSTRKQDSVSGGFSTLSNPERQSQSGVSDHLGLCETDHYLSVYLAGVR